MNAPPAKPVSAMPSTRTQAKDVTMLARTSPLTGSALESCLLIGFVEELLIPPRTKRRPLLGIFNLDSLTTGDYSVAGLEDLFAIERKTVSARRLLHGR